MDIPAPGLVRVFLGSSRGKLERCSFPCNISYREPWSQCRLLPSDIVRKTQGSSVAKMASNEIIPRQIAINRPKQAP